MEVIHQLLSNVLLLVKEVDEDVGYATCLDDNTVDVHVEIVVPSSANHLAATEDSVVMDGTRLCLGLLNVLEPCLLGIRRDVFHHHRVGVEALADVLVELTSLKEADDAYSIGLPH